MLLLNTQLKQCRLGNIMILELLCKENHTHHYTRKLLESYIPHNKFRTLKMVLICQTIATHKTT